MYNPNTQKLQEETHDNEKQQQNKLQQQNFIHINLVEKLLKLDRIRQSIIMHKIAQNILQQIILINTNNTINHQNHTRKINAIKQCQQLLTITATMKDLGDHRFL